MTEQTLSKVGFERGGGTAKQGECVSAAYNRSGGGVPAGFRGRTPAQGASPP